MTTLLCNCFLRKLEHTHDFDGYRQWLTEEAKRQQDAQSILIDQLEEIELRLESIQDEILSLRVDMKQGKITEKEGEALIARRRVKEGKLETVKAQLTEKLQQRSDEDKPKGRSPQVARKFEEFHVELQILKQVWHKKPIGRKQEFINTLVEKAVLVMESAHWLRLDIYWGYPVWTPDRIYIHRTRGKTPFWTDEEKAILAKLYPTAPAEDILMQLPYKSWASIRSLAFQLGIKREVFGKNTLPLPLHETWSDYLFTQKQAQEEYVFESQVEESVKTE